MTGRSGPIVSFYRVTPDIAAVEIFTDLSNDHFGAGGWKHDLRPGLDAAIAVQGCVKP
jgi:hypothetical protein